MYQARLISGVPLQIQVPGDIERSKDGSLYLQMDNPIEITDDEADHIRRQMENPKSGLGSFRIVLEEIKTDEAVTTAVETKEPIAAVHIEPEVVDADPAPELEPVTKPEGVEATKPKGKATKRRRKG